jgi:hypothetical protein
MSNAVGDDVCTACEAPRPDFAKQEMVGETLGALPRIADNTIHRSVHPSSGVNFGSRPRIPMQKAAFMGADAEIRPSTSATLLGN